MQFLIQKENNKYNLDNHILSDLISDNHLLHSYRDWSINDFKEPLPELKDYIPLGDIPFTEKYFKICYGIEHENPIEIPPVLRTPEFLKRKYFIVKSDEVPRTGNFFLKDVSRLKVFSYTGNMEYFDKELEKEHLYQVSEIIPILSEYRVFVLDNKIYSINNYDGDVTIFPDISLIQKAINIWKWEKDYPKSYSMDVAITPKGTALLECHILFSTGIYNTVLGTNFLYGYRDAKDYLLNFNTPIKECKIL